MSDPTNCAAMCNVISLPASQDGPTPLTLPDGRVIDPCGLAAALASLSARQVKALGLRTSGIYGPPGSISSRSAGLQSSLESRLQARLRTLGSTLYTLTWKAWVTPSGVSRFRLRGSARRTSETATTGWPTPTTRDWKDGAFCQNVPINALLGRSDWLAGWPTPRAADTVNTNETPEHWAAREVAAKAKNPRLGGLHKPLGIVAKMAGWPTPITNDALGSGYCYGPKKPDGTRAKFWKLSVGLTDVERARLEQPYRLHPVLGHN